MANHGKILPLSAQPRSVVVDTLDLGVRPAPEHTLAFQPRALVQPDDVTHDAEVFLGARRDWTLVLNDNRPELVGDGEHPVGPVPDLTP